MDVGAKIREARKSKGLAQAELSERSGISRSHIAAIEAGTYSPTFHTLEAIANACGMCVKDLL